MKIPKPPKHLGKHGRDFWRGVLSDYDFTDTHEFSILTEASGCLDRIAEARAEIANAGSYFTERWGQPKQHPAHSVERDNRTLFARLVRELNLDITPPETRPPRRY